MKKSISTKILKAVLIGLSIIVVLMTVISIAVVSKISEDNSKTLMTQICEKETLRLDNEFALLENSVTTITEFVREQEEQSSLEEMLTDEFCGKVQEMALSIANRTDGAMAVYFRYNPELTGNGTGGFFWSRDNDGEMFSYEQPTDILAYSEDDTEHVGWFYEPKESQQPIWMSPYYNKNLNVFMISYVIPYFAGSGDFLGVIGMDIDFSKIVGLTGNVKLYRTGTASVVDSQSGCCYSIDEAGNIAADDLTHIFTDSKPGLIPNNAESARIIRNGNNLCICSEPLRNGMNLLISVPLVEINAQRNYLMAAYACIIAAAFLITIFVIAHITNRIVYPLKVLTRITGKYADGNWDETYVSNTGDEIQQLSESISAMAETTKTYIDEIHKSSVTDTLTGLKNKNCYLSFIKKYQNGEVRKYSVGVFDLNFLKNVNDIYGHETGDRFIRSAGQYICDVFQHSPVFRIGGDEFAVILGERDYEIKEELCRKFEAGIKDMPAAADGIPFSISYGMADVPEDAADYDEAFRCADERMYAFKKSMKAERN